MDERLKAIKDEYGLEASDMWQLPQNKQWLIKHDGSSTPATLAPSAAPRPGPSSTKSTPPTASGFPTSTLPTGSQPVA